MSEPRWPWSPESLVEAMFDRAPIGLCVVDRERRYVRINETAAAMNGLPVADHIGRRMEEILPQLADAVDPLVQRILTTGQAITSREVSADDPHDPSRKVWYLGSGYPVQSPTGEVIGVGIVAVDITARKRAEEALRESETRFRQLAENIDAVFWLGQVDPPKAIYVSPAFERVWGLSRETHYADPFAYFRALHPDDREILQRAQGRLPDQGFDVEFRIIHPDGSLHWVHDRAFPVPPEPGVPRRVAGILSDVTEQKRLEEQLHQAQKMESLGRLAGGMAHDFNNLMTAVLGHVSFAAETLPPGHEAREELSAIEQAALRASELTRQLLAFARLQHVAPRVVDVNELVASLQGLLRRLIGEDIDLATRLVPESVCACIDPIQLEQVLVNLAVNARDAMPHGGSLVLETSSVVVKTEAHLPLPEGPYVRVAVRDTGHGIGPNVREHLFEPFFTTKQPGKGTGLGLATCYGIVQQCGGHIAVESEPEQGARFEVYLPRVDAPPLAVPKSDAGPAPSGTETVLLVEDEAPVRAVALRALRALGYRVLEAADGDEALAVAKAYTAPIDLLVADVVMPRLGGIELARRLRAKRPRIRVLHVSGYIEPALREGPAVVPGAAFLYKPFLPEALARKVRELLDLPERDA
jgi:two-component system, cell cycle sensor histidine kinase and response regulator CckA